MTPVAVGIDVGGTKMLGTAVDKDGRILAKQQVETPANGEALLGALVGVVGGLRETEPGAAGGPVGVGMPGLVDRSGTLRYAPHLPGIIGLDVRGELASRLACDVQAVVVDNDATCAGVAEHALGAARGAADAVVVTLGTGIGGALVAGGRLLRGASNFAGEIGHMVIDRSGPTCWCGGHGCWESYASGSALGRLAREAAAAGRAGGIAQRAGGSEAVRGEHVVDAAAAGDPEAAAVFDEYGYWVGLGLANLASLLDPEVIVVGGGLVRAGEVMLAPIRSAFRAIVEGAEHRPDTPIVPASMGPDAGAIGAAFLALADAGGRG